jgi:hypothetical protein
VNRCVPRGSIKEDLLNEPPGIAFSGRLVNGQNRSPFWLDNAHIDCKNPAAALGSQAASAASSNNPAAALGSQAAPATWLPADAGWVSANVVTSRRSSACRLVICACRRCFCQCWDYSQTQHLAGGPHERGSAMQG